MQIECTINEKPYKIDVTPSDFLIDALRRLGFYSVKRGCETSACGLCTVLVNDKTVLSCSVLTASIHGKRVVTLEGLQEEAKIFGDFLANEGSEQCGYCSPGFIMNVLAMEKELENPSDDEIKKYLVGNLCRCTGYMGQLRAIKKYFKRGKGADYENSK